MPAVLATVLLSLVYGLLALLLEPRCIHSPTAVHLFFISAACPEGYSKPFHSSRSCFSVKNTALSWEDALSSCARQDGILASFQSMEEAHFVAKLLKGNFFTLTYDAVAMFKCQDPFKISRKYVTEDI